MREPDKLLESLKHEAAPITRYSTTPSANIIDTLSASDYPRMSNGKVDPTYAVIALIRSRHKCTKQFASICSCCQKDSNVIMLANDPLKIKLCDWCNNLAVIRSQTIIRRSVNEFVSHLNDGFSTVVFQLISDKIRIYTLRKWDLRQLKRRYIKYTKYIKYIPVITNYTNYTNYTDSELGKQCQICNAQPTATICSNCHKMMAVIYAGECANTWWHLRQLCCDIPSDIFNLIIDRFIYIMLFSDYID